MRSPYAPGRRRPSGSLVLAVVLVTGAWLVNDGLRTSAPPQPAAGQAQAADGTSGTGGTAAALPRSVPVRVRVPALGVDAPLVRLGLDPAGHLTPPPAGRPREAGWFAGGVSPGERGTAVIAGHVDTLAGPAVFYALGAARKGWTVAVDRTDGSTVAFTVDAVAVYAKDRFPDRTVYAAASRPELRLITCGGEFREGSGYSGDVVVFAHLTGASPTPARDRARTAAGTPHPRARARTPALGPAPPLGLVASSGPVPPPGLVASSGPVPPPGPVASSGSARSPGSVPRAPPVPGGDPVDNGTDPHRCHHFMPKIC